ncbi:MAG: FAD-dependent oxidoreductase, partial [bacterium]|nr:FAD-dependent oxidoreductase [bacterium]
MADFTLNRTLPLDDSWDVIVVGGGPSGCTAAAAAAREGAKTLLIEGTGALGGMGTSALVPAWCPFSDKEKMLHRGLAEKVFTEAFKGVPHEPKDRLDWVAINPEHLKRVYDDLVTDAGVTVLFHTFLAAVEGTGTVDAIVAGNKAGLTAYRAKVYVDCTGDADVAAWAGAEFEQGEPGTGEVQPATHCFTLTNVDHYAFKTGPRVFPWVPGNPTRMILDSGKYPRIRDGHACDAVIGP